MIIIKFKLLAEVNKSRNNWIKAQLYLIEWQSVNDKTPQIFTKLKMVIYMEKGYIEYK